MISGNEALSLVDSYRLNVQDNTHFEDLSQEFPSYSKKLGEASVLLMRLDDNLSGAFKWRGAIVGATKLKQEGATKLIVPSAGNHARGAVWAAKQLDLDVTTVVPASAPPQKRELIRELWDSPKLNIEVIGDSFDESLAWALDQTDGQLLHPYGEEVIPGQGTVVDDILSNSPDVTTIVTPVGGGGLASGILRRLDELGRQDITVVGVEASGSNSLSNSLQSGHVTTADHPNARYGGSAVSQTSQPAYEICNNAHNLKICQVSDDEVSDLINLYKYDRNRQNASTSLNIEPTSLVAIASLAKLQIRGTTVVLASGHNDALPDTSK